jgi:sarcosine oxidase
MQICDAIVLGAGGIGSAVLYHLARRGATAVGIDQFPLAHDRGSSHGQTRIIRQAYFEHPNYVPLVLRAYEHWAELERASRRKLFHQVGLLQVGPPRGKVLSGVLASAAAHRLPIEELSPTDVAARWPIFRMPDAGMRGVFEANAGYLEVEECVRAHAFQAQRCGATLLFGESVQAWNNAGDLVRVRTASGELAARRLIITAGAWSSRVLADLGIEFEVLRKPMFWFRSPDMRYKAPQCPCFLFESAAGEFYGFPSLEPFGMKVAEHTGGQPVGDPTHVPRELDPRDLAAIQDFLRRHVPGLDPKPSQHAVCLYTMSPDRHFVVDRHPRHENVFFAAGLSGHGFKFAPVLGEALADLALTGQTTLPIEFLNARRFQGADVTGGEK